MVPCVLMMIMAYNKNAPNKGREKYENKKKNKNGNMHMAINQLINGIQFLFDLKTLMREKASEYSCLREGVINFPSEFAQPYEGV